MDWIDWKQIINTIIGSGICLSAAAVIFKLLFQYKINKNLENHKAELSTILEQKKADFQTDLIQKKSLH